MPSLVERENCYLDGEIRSQSNCRNYRVITVKVKIKPWSLVITVAIDNYLYIVMTKHGAFYITDGVALLRLLIANGGI